MTRCRAGSGLANPNVLTDPAGPLGRGRLQGDADERARGPRLLSHRWVDLMRTNFLSRDQRRIPAFGQIVWGPRL
jgi:hypothetical protein